MTNTPKYCEDCKWSRRNRFFKLLTTLWCGHPSIVNPVSGKPSMTCKEQRTSFRSLWSECGKDGKLFERK